MAKPIKGVDTEWSYHDSHLTNLTDKNFLTSARCIIYARPTRVAEDGEERVFRKIGVIQGYSWSEQKQIEMIFELGSDIPYIIPGRTQGSLSISRILIAGADLLNIFYLDDDVRDGEVITDGWIRSLRDITTPLDLLFTYYDQTSTAVYTRLFGGAHIQSRQESISAQQTIVSEQVNIMYQHVTQYSTTSGTSINNPLI